MRRYLGFGSLIFSVFAALWRRGGLARAFLYAPTASLALSRTGRFATGNSGLCPTRTDERDRSVALHLCHDFLGEILDAPLDTFADLEACKTADGGARTA